MLSFFRQYKDSWLFKTLFGILIISFIISLGSTHIFRNDNPALLSLGSKNLYAPDIRAYYTTAFTDIYAKSSKRIRDTFEAEEDIKIYSIKEVLNLDANLNNFYISDDLVKKEIQDCKLLRDSSGNADTAKLKLLLDKQNISINEFWNAMRLNLTAYYWLEYLEKTMFEIDIVPMTLSACLQAKREIYHQKLLYKDIVVEEPDNQMLEEYMKVNADKFNTPSAKVFHAIMLRDEKLVSEIMDEVSAAKSLQSIAKEHKGVRFYKLRLANAANYGDANSSTMTSNIPGATENYNHNEHSHHNFQETANNQDVSIAPSWIDAPAQIPEKLKVIANKLAEEEYSSEIKDLNGNYWIIKFVRKQEAKLPPLLNIREKVYQSYMHHERLKKAQQKATEIFNYTPDWWQGAVKESVERSRFDNTDAMDITQQRNLSIEQAVFNMQKQDFFPIKDGLCLLKLVTTHIDKNINNPNFLQVKAQQVKQDWLNGYLHYLYNYYKVKEHFPS